MASTKCESLSAPLLSIESSSENTATLLRPSPHFVKKKSFTCTHSHHFNTTCSPHPCLCQHNQDTNSPRSTNTSKQRLSNDKHQEQFLARSPPCNSKNFPTLLVYCQALATLVKVFFPRCTPLFFKIAHIPQAQTSAMNSAPGSIKAHRAGPQNMYVITTGGQRHED